MGSKGAQRGRGGERTEIIIKKIDPGWKKGKAGRKVKEVKVKSRGRRMKTEGRMKKSKEDDRFEEASKQR